MTTPDKEEMPTEDRTAGPWRLSLVSDAITQEIWSYTVRPELFATCRGQRARANAAFIVTACNAYEPMREALENARALWGHRCFDTPQLTWLAQVDAALSTLPVNDRQTSDDVGILRDAARRAHDTLIEINQYNYTHADVCELNDASVEAILILADAIGERHGKTEKWWNDRRAALKGVPQPASDDYQADASAPALSETVSVRSEQKRRQKNMLTDLVDAVLYLNDIVGDLDETGKTSSTRLGHLQRAVDRLLESISSADTGAKLNFSNEAARDGGENA